VELTRLSVSVRAAGDNRRASSEPGRRILPDRHHPTVNPRVHDRRLLVSLSMVHSTYYHMVCSRMGGNMGGDFCCCLRIFYCKTIHIISFQTRQTRVQEFYYEMDPPSSATLERTLRDDRKSKGSQN
jgi:hypothetical protein